jgi:protein SCO1/2
MFEISKTLKAIGEDAKDFRVFCITGDPQRNTAPQLNDYLSNFDPCIEVLGPPADELAKVGKEFLAEYAKASGSIGDNSTVHSAPIYLMWTATESLQARYLMTSHRKGEWQN